MSEEEKSLGFVLIFDGSTLAGWDAATNWTEATGELVCIGQGTDLRYVARTVPDHFELRFEWRATVNGEGGVLYRPGLVKYQIVDAANAQAQTSHTRAGALFMCAGPPRELAKPAGSWNESRILCRGTTVEHWLNGQRVVALDYTEKEWAAPLARLREHELQRFKRNSGDLTARGGHLALESVNGTASFRRLRWRKYND